MSIVLCMGKNDKGDAVGSGGVHVNTCIIINYFSRDSLRTLLLCIVQVIGGFTAFYSSLPVFSRALRSLVAVLDVL